MPKISFGVTNYSPARLRRLLKFLTHLEYGFAPGESATSACIRMTFDDAYEHLAEYLPPLMDEFNLRPLVFVPTAYIGKENSWDYSSGISPVKHLTAEQIKALARSGVEFGSHGHRHVDLTGLSDDGLREDLRTSKAILEDMLGTGIESLSYPFGRFNAKVGEVSSELGFRRGYTMSFPGPEDQTMTRGRYPVYAYDSPFTVRQKLAGGPLKSVERLKTQMTNKLSGGTILWNRWFGRSGQ